MSANCIIHIWHSRKYDSIEIGIFLLLLLSEGHIGGHRRAHQLACISASIIQYTPVAISAEFVSYTGVCRISSNRPVRCSIIKLWGLRCRAVTRRSAIALIKISIHLKITKIARCFILARTWRVLLAPLRFRHGLI